MDMMARNQKICIQLLRIGSQGSQLSRHVSRNIFMKLKTREDTKRSHLFFSSTCHNYGSQKKGQPEFYKNVNLNLIGCSLEFLSRFSPNKVDFQPHLLTSSGAEKRYSQV